LLMRDFNAQWNDDGHHVLHHLLTGESQGYYADYLEETPMKLARFLAEGFIYQGQPSTHRNGNKRGHPSASLEPTAFILFLQNHDQLGNRAFGDRLITLAPEAALCAAYALLLLSPQIPMLFMGEEQGAKQPFLYFTSHTAPGLPEAVRVGRQAEFAAFEAFASEELRARIPDPNDSNSYESSIVPAWGNDLQSLGWIGLTHKLLSLRHTHVIPRLAGTRSLGARPVDGAGAMAQWRMGDGAILSIAINLGQEKAPLNPEELQALSSGDLLFATDGVTDALRAEGSIPPESFIAVLEKLEEHHD
jgi:maltooligosyltrehalose trehalohydrolase